MSPKNERPNGKQCRADGSYNKLESDVRLSCHENVTQIAENGCKSAATNNEGGRKQVPGFCPNLLIPLD